MSDEEVVIWSGKAGMADFLVYPIHWIYTIGTGGIYLVWVFFSRRGTKYTLTTQRLKIENGFFSKRIDEIELFRIKDTRVRLGFFEKLVGYGTIEIESTDKTRVPPLKHMKNVIEKREEIRGASQKSRVALGIKTVVNE